LHWLAPAKTFGVQPTGDCETRAGSWAEAGLTRDALYLLRPDSYIALVEPSGSPRAVADYFVRNRIAPSALRAA